MTEAHAIPRSYVTATWRNTTPIDRQAQAIGVGFTLESGEIVRLRLDLDSARHLVETLSGYIADYGSYSSQSDRSAGIPRVDGSMPEEGKKV